MLETLDYVPASPEFNLTQARAMLELLYGDGLETIAEVGGGVCLDCGNVAVLLRYARKRDLCRRCAQGRRRVARKLEHESGELLADETIGEAA